MATATGKTWMNMATVARALGISPMTMSRAARMHPLYAPAIRGLSGCNLGRDLCLYHAEQLRLLLAVNVAKTIDIDTATLEWEVFRRRIADKKKA